MAPIVRPGRLALVRRGAGLTRRLAAALLALVVTGPFAAMPAEGLVLPAAAAPPLDREPVPQEVDAAHQAILELRRVDAGLAHFFDASVGYVVFATVRRGTPGVGGTDGLGILFVDGQAVGRVRLSQAASRSEPGSRSYTEVVFLETPQALAAFVGGTFALGARAVSVDAAARTSASSTFEAGSSVVTLGWVGPGGVEPLGGQRFSYLAFERRLAASAR